MYKHKFQGLDCCVVFTKYCRHQLSNNVVYKQISPENILAYMQSKNIYILQLQIRQYLAFKTLRVRLCMSHSFKMFGLSCIFQCITHVYRTVGLPDILSLANLFPIHGKQSPPNPGTALWTGAWGPAAVMGLWAGTRITPRLPMFLFSP